jgi:WD40 repeat protein
MSSPEGPAHAVLLAAGTATYKSAMFEALDQVPQALAAVVETFTELGYAAVAADPGYCLNPKPDDLRAAVYQAAVAGGVVVFYYTGHGARYTRDDYYLVSSQSQPADLSLTAMPAAALPGLLVRRGTDGEPDAEQPTALIILDCCFSGQAGLDILGEGLRGAGNSNTWVIASATSVQYAQQGVFAEALCEALRSPWAGASTEFLSLDSIVGQINEILRDRADQEARCFSPATGSSGIPPFFKNRFHQPGLAGLTVNEQDHLLASMGGGPHKPATGFYLAGVTGRVRAAEDLAIWMADQGRTGLAVMTGSPGTGKSALLALLARLTEPANRDELLLGADNSAIIRRAADRLSADVSVRVSYARGLNAEQAAAAVARALDRDASTVSALIEDLAAIPGNDGQLPVLVIDGVDEAASPSALITRLVLPLCRQLRMKVVVGVRRHLLPQLGGADLVIDLDSGAYHDPQALTEYVRQLLIATQEPGVSTPYQAAAAAGSGFPQDTVTVVARALARRATDGAVESFLFARLLAMSVRSRPEPVDVTSADWESMLPADLTDAFDEDLARLGTGAPLARTLLTALSWAKGPGLPRDNIWTAVGGALGDGRPSPVTNSDIEWLLSTASDYIIEDLGPGQRSVYRLFHDLLATSLRGHSPTGVHGAADDWPGRRAQVEEAITHSLLDTVPTDSTGQRQWALIHPYLRTYLAQHAAGAGPEVLAALMDVRDFLAVADSATLTPLLTSAGLGQPGQARAYLRARSLLGDNLAANAAYLEEAEVALNGAAPRGNAAIRPLYRTRLASVRRDDSLLTLTDAAPIVNSLAFGTGPGGQLLLASGGSDWNIRLWDPMTGAAIGPPLAGHAERVTSVAFGIGPGEQLLLASGSGDGTLRLWDPLAEAPARQALAAHAGAVSSVAFGAGPDGRLLVASGGDDGMVRLWDALTGIPAVPPITIGTGTVVSLALGTAAGSRSLLAATDPSGTVRLWDLGRPGTVPMHTLSGTPRVMRPRRLPRPGETEWSRLTRVAFGGRPGGPLLLATGSEDTTVQLWDPVSGKPTKPALTGHDEEVTAVAFGFGRSDRLLLASGSADTTVRIWDPVAGIGIGPELRGHAKTVTSVALGATPDRRPLLASGSWDGTIRVWDPLPVGPARQALRGHAGAVTAIASGSRCDGGPLLASGGDDGTIRLWDPSTGGPAGPTLSGQPDAIISIALGTGPDGQSLLASVNDGRTMQLRETATGTSASAWTWSPVEILSSPEEEPVVSAPVTSVALGIRPTGHLLLACGSADGTIWLWDPDTGNPLGPPFGQPLRWRPLADRSRVWPIAFSDARGGPMLLASPSYDDTVPPPDIHDPQYAWKLVGEAPTLVRLWNPLTGTTVGGPLGGHRGGVTSLAFGIWQDDRPLLATGANDALVRLWDPLTGHAVGEPLFGHFGGITSVAFGKWEGDRLVLATGATDGTVRLWDIPGLTCFAAIHRRTSVNALAFTGEALAIGDAEGISVIDLSH